MRPRGSQLPLVFRRHGGARAGAGRKRRAARPNVPHRPRDPHDPRCPVHVTLRSVRLPRSLRAATVFPAVLRALGRASTATFRVLQFSVQRDHVHLLVEADTALARTRGIQGLAIRLARAVNRALGRQGTVWGDRHHARVLATPRAVRHALVYVLQNFRKHGHEGPGTDPCSSARWFGGWMRPVSRMADSAPVVAARTWLARWGWRRYGLLDPRERPAAVHVRATRRSGPARHRGRRSSR